MGINGLIPFLEKSSRRCNVSEFSGQAVAIDAYCWLHKGSFSCADKLAIGQPTDAYVKYCLKYIEMLLANRIRPILVFDGGHLPAKAQTEAKRKELRNENRRKACELIRLGHHAKGHSLLQRSVDISHEMALELIKHCQSINIDCIVAPFEADAQLAYLNVQGIADVVITEDSDLTLFGCTKVLFKMDLQGNGLLVEQDRLHLAMGIPSEHFHMDKFRYMCILSGCDYLRSLPGIGLNKACKFVLKTSDDDFYEVLSRIGHYLNMRKLVVPDDYKEEFKKAVVTFKYQLVYCPLKREQVRLNPPSEEVTADQLYYAGSEKDSRIAWQLALGNCDPLTLTKLHDFDPDSRKEADKSSSDRTALYHRSIWSKDFIAENRTWETQARSNESTWSNAKGQAKVHDTKDITWKKTARKRPYASATSLDVEACEEEKDILKFYEIEKQQVISPANKASSPPLNSFAKRPKNEQTSPSVLLTSRRRLGLHSTRFKPTIINDNVIVESKFFSKLSHNENPKIEELTSKERLSEANPEVNPLQRDNLAIPEVVLKETISSVISKIPVENKSDFKPEVLIESESNAEPEATLNDEFPLQVEVATREADIKGFVGPEIDKENEAKRKRLKEKEDSSAYLVSRENIPNDWSTAVENTKIAPSKSRKRYTKQILQGQQTLLTMFAFRKK